MAPRSLFVSVVAVFAVAAPAYAKPTVLDAKLHHLRAGAEREWTDFPAQAEGPSLSLTFQAERNAAEWTLRLRQQDVKQTWRVLLNSKELAKLPPDENDQVLYLPVPAGALVPGENKLVVEPVGKVPDDIRVGEIILDDRPRAEALSEATVEITVHDGTCRDKPAATPCRLTIVNDRGALVTTSAASGERLAARPGVIYTADGTANFGLPVGEYTIYAGRGFAYGINSVKVSLKAGDAARKTLTIRRDVGLDGWASCDTHVHTLTYSGHGDCAAEERVITLAGEGVELPIITDHNKQIDLNSVAVKFGVRAYFTPVVGNEVTTNVGHFNIFPARAGGPVPDFQGKDWATVFKSISERTGAKVVILNHPRDKHSGFRPFGPEHHLALTGGNLDGWELKANAMEVVNSGAQQTDVMRPLHDWMGLLNRGVQLTPVGASDSHDVSRFIVGQGRTYVRCKNDNPGKIDVDEAVKNFAEGRVMVSCGLLAEITVNGKYGPGDLVPAKGDVKVSVRVLGPAWTSADRVELYANGHLIRQALIDHVAKDSVKWSGEWTLPRFKHDVHLVAVASGPGVTAPYWPIAKPYQPTSTAVNRRVLGASGAVWLDADGDGKRTSARGYAERLLKDAGGEWAKLVPALADYDEAVCAQAAALLQAKGVSVRDDKVREAAKAAGEHAIRAFDAYAAEWRDSQIAREEAKKP
jgi:hypothetical protein